MTETTHSPIRVLLVEDSTLVLTILRRILATSSEVRVVGTAANGQEALRLIPEVNPAIVCTDLHMPVMDGLELTRRIMADCPKPILVISAAVQEEDAENVFQLLEAGALDVFPKPRGGDQSDYDQVASQLIRKIRVLSGVHVLRKKPRKVFGGASRRASRPPEVAGSMKTPQPSLVGIGASTGGPHALEAVLSKLPADFPVPIVCVQHISEGFLPGLIKWLDSHCRLHAKIAENGVLPEPGTIYFAPDRLHMEIDAEGRMVTTADPALNGHRPSVNVLLRSVARHAGSGALGVLLTGMGRDGAEGMQAIAGAGGSTIAQDEETCVVFGMPKQAIELGAVQHVLPLGSIAHKLKQICMSPARSRT